MTSLKLYRRLGDRYGEARALAGLGILAAGTLRRRARL
jgi:hypothetical protein